MNRIIVLFLASVSTSIHVVGARSPRMHCANRCWHSLAPAALMTPKSSRYIRFGAAISTIPPCRHWLVSVANTEATAPPVIDEISLVFRFPCFKRPRARNARAIPSRTRRWTRVFDRNIKRLHSLMSRRAKSSSVSKSHVELKRLTKFSQLTVGQRS